MENNLQNKQTKNSTTSRSWELKWDFSMLVAVIAVLISLVSAYLSFKESIMMQEQQRILSSQ